LWEEKRETEAHRTNFSLGRWGERYLYLEVSTRRDFPGKKIKKPKHSGSGVGVGWREAGRRPHHHILGEERNWRRKERGSGVEREGVRKKIL